MQKTLGGDRIGSGKKMKVELHNYGRSTHDLSYIWRSTMSAGTLVPFMSEVGLPGDTFDINLDCDVKTHPTIGPLFGSYKVQLDTYVAPIRLYIGALHNNALNIGRNMSQIKLPKIILTALSYSFAQITTAISENKLDNMQINPSCIFSYLGIRGIGLTEGAVPVNRVFNAIPWLAYWEIYKNYYANKQEEIGAVIHTDIAANVETIDAGGFTIFWNQDPATLLTLPQDPARDNIVLDSASPSADTIRIQFTGATPQANQIYVLIVKDGNTEEWIQASTLGRWTTALIPTYIEMVYDNRFGKISLLAWRYRNNTDTINVPPNVTTFPLDNIDDMRNAILQHVGLSEFLTQTVALSPYNISITAPSGFYTAAQSQEGLAVKTYQSDLFNNWLKTENIDAISTQTAISTSGASFTIDQLNLSKKVYNMLNRINVSGGSYNDWIDAVYVHEKYRQSESPMYMGGLIKELVFQEVVSNSESASGQPLGTLAGRGIMGKKHKGGKVVIHVDEPCYIIGIISLTPRLDYSQGNKWDTRLNTMDDFHKPALDEIGFQDLITEQMAWWDSYETGGTWFTRSAGKQPAWINYMTNVNQTRGNFAITDNEMFMTLNRRYTPVFTGVRIATIEDLTSYIDPAKFNFIFAETALDAQNFWVQIAVDITARRKMSAKIMPNL